MLKNRKKVVPGSALTAGDLEYHNSRIVEPTPTGTAIEIKRIGSDNLRIGGRLSSTTHNTPVGAKFEM